MAKSNWNAQTIDLIYIGQPSRVESRMENGKENLECYQKVSRMPPRHLFPFSIYYTIVLYPDEEFVSPVQRVCYVLPVNNLEQGDVNLIISC